MKNWLLGILALSLAALSFAFGCWIYTIIYPSKPEGAKGKAITVTVVDGEAELKRFVPLLPPGDRPVAAVQVPNPPREPGMVAESWVVHGASGTTYTAVTQSIDWGFRFEPAASVGLSDHILVGVDVTWFSYWRLNADAVVYLPIGPELDAYLLRAGPGLSFQLTDAASVGAAYLIDARDRRYWAAFASLKLF